MGQQVDESSCKLRCGHRGQLREVEVALQVAEIRAYGRVLDEVDEGLTALLVLKGTVPDDLGEGCVLTG
jgi:hypothetical protein